MYCESVYLTIFLQMKKIKPKPKTYYMKPLQWLHHRPLLILDIQRSAIPLMWSQETDKQWIYHYLHQISSPILRFFRLPQNQRINPRWHCHNLLLYNFLDSIWCIKTIRNCNQSWSRRTPRNESFTGPETTSKMVVLIRIAIRARWFKRLPTNCRPFCHW